MINRSASLLPRTGEEDEAAGKPNRSQPAHVSPDFGCRGDSQRVSLRDEPSSPPDLLLLISRREDPWEWGCSSGPPA